jgi:hypothetical protein
MNVRSLTIKNSSQFLLIDFLGDIGIRMQNNPGLQGVADQFFLTRALDRLPITPRNLKALGDPER